MPKAKSHFICQECGAVYPKYQGQCYHCGGWNTIVEEVEAPAGSKIAGISFGDSLPTPVPEIKAIEANRLRTGIGEFDRVTGGGLVPGSLVLIGGTPGIGKSTLLLSVSHNIAEKYDGKVLYVSGEESPQQIKMRADRLGVTSEKLLILPEIEMDTILGYIIRYEPSVVIIDSIQTMVHSAVESAPGSVSQVRECAGLLQRVCKKSGIPVILVGHVTKSGAIAGPMVLEHIVDTVLFFEGENIRDFRILRTRKNRFGSTQEIGVFAMESTGLRGIDNPSEFFISRNSLDISGSVVVPVIEGTRTILVEIQALVSQSGFGMPARRTTGVPVNRLTVLLAVLEKRARLLLGGTDVFINVVGGVQVDEPAVDLGVVMAIVSGMRDRPMPPHTCVVGEVGLGGELRGVSRIEERIREAAKMGFKKIILPQVNITERLSFPDMELTGAEHIKEALARGLGKGS